MRTGLIRWIGLLSITTLALPILAACGGGESEPTATPPPAESSGETDETDAAQPADVQLAPEFGSIDRWYNGGATSLAALRGQPVLLVFWADY